MSPSNYAATTVYYDSEFREYVVKVRVRGVGGNLERHEAADYYTNDKADAIGTALLMRSELDDTGVVAMAHSMGNV